MVHTAVSVTTTVHALFYRPAVQSYVHTDLILGGTAPPVPIGISQVHTRGKDYDASAPYRPIGLHHMNELYSGKQTCSGAASAHWQVQ